MKIAVISDIHCHFDAVTPEADVLVVAGDMTSSGSRTQVDEFAKWLKKQPQKYKVVVAGNHDWFFATRREEEILNLFTDENTHYLKDSSVFIEGLKFYGSPWQPAFCNWAFNLPRSGTGLKEVWDKIPEDTDVLVTHSPPKGKRDTVREGHPSGNLGCELLYTKVTEVKPKLHIFGHIHGGYGVEETDTTTFVNASLCNEMYEPTNPIQVLEIDYDKS